MNSRNSFLLGFGICLALLVTGGVAHAANVFTITGPSPWWGFGNHAVLVQAWTQTVTYTNVSIAMPLEDNSQPDPIVGVEGTVYLMNQIGPGTTAANNVAPPVSISGLTALFTTRTPFSGLTLPAGNYYVVWFPTNTSPLSMSPASSDTRTVTAGNGVAALGAGSTLTPAGFPPASIITLNPPGHLFITVTGDLVPTPVPTLDTVGLGVLMFAFAGAALLLLRRRRA